MKNSKQKQAVFFILVYFMLLTLPAAGMFFFPEDDAGENRRLSGFPSLFQGEHLLNLSFFQEFDTWLNEHIGFRSYLVNADNRWQMALFGQSPEESVIVGKDGWLYYAETKNDYLNLPALSERNFNNIGRTLKLMQDHTEERGSAFVVAIAPNKSSLYGDAMPYYYIPSQGKGNLELLYDAMDSAGVVYADLYDAFRKEEEVLYLSMDSHWSYKGALLAYNTILDRISYDHNTFWEMSFTNRKDWEPDLAGMLYAGSVPTDWQAYPEYEFSYEITSHETAVDAITLQTVCEEGDGSLLIYRDSFCNTMQVYFAENFSEALFSRAYPFLMDYVDRCNPDVTVLEIVERNIANLAAKAPVMEAPEAELRIEVTKMPGKDPVFLAEEAGEYLHVYGYLDEEILGSKYQVYVYCRTEEEVRAYEAFPIFEGELLGAETQGDNGFSAYLPMEDISKETEFCLILAEENQYYLSEVLGDP